MNQGSRLGYKVHAPYSRGKLCLIMNYELCYTIILLLSYFVMFYSVN